MQCDINETGLAWHMKSHGFLGEYIIRQSSSHVHDSVFQDVGYDHVNNDCLFRKEAKSIWGYVHSRKYVPST